MIGGCRTQVGLETPGSGEVEALEALFTTCFWPVVAYGVRRGLQEATARDVADALTIAWRHHRSIPTDTVLPWLYGTTAKLIANEHRRVRRATGLHHRLTTTAGGLDVAEDMATAVDAGRAVSTSSGPGVTARIPAVVATGVIAGLLDEVRALDPAAAIAARAPDPAGWWRSSLGEPPSGSSSGSS